MKLHIAFEKKFIKAGFLGFVFAFVMLLATLATTYFRLDSLAILAAIIFITSVLGIALYLRYLLQNVECPACQMQCVTYKDPRSKLWIAKCTKCSQTWNLGIGLKSPTDGN
jgi:hypothetical protein